jgi:hypothetical protein
VKAAPLGGSSHNNSNRTDWGDGKMEGTRERVFVLLDCGYKGEEKERAVCVCVERQEVWACLSVRVSI